MLKSKDLLRILGYTGGKGLKLVIIGSYDEQHQVLGGQHDRTEIIVERLFKKLRKDTIQFYNIFPIRKNKFLILWNAIQVYLKNEKIVYITSTRGTLFFTALFGVLRFIIPRKLYCVVIGSCNITRMKKHKVIFKLFQNLNGSFYETEMLREIYERGGCKRTYYFPNGKIIKLNKINALSFSKPYKFCTYSRITREKGILDAIYAIKKVNTSYSEAVCTLDIYGKVDDNFKEEFEAAIRGQDAIKFCGKIERSQSTQVLSRYIAMLFPTHHKAEGVPGGVIDAYEAGLPVIATNISFNSELIKDGRTGYIYQEDKPEDLVYIIKQMADKPEEIIAMRKNCLAEARKYDIERHIDRFIKILN